MTADRKVIGIPHQNRGAHDRFAGVDTGSAVTNPDGFLHAVQRHVHQ